MNVAEMIALNYGVENMAEQAYTFRTLIGDGLNYEYNVNHALNSDNVVANVYDAATKELVIADIVKVDSNIVRVTFGNPPGMNQYELVVIG